VAEVNGVCEHGDDYERRRSSVRAERVRVNPGKVADLW
jgi:hypothetical protein